MSFVFIVSSYAGVNLDHLKHFDCPAFGTQQTNMITVSNVNLLTYIKNPAVQIRTFPQATECIARQQPALLSSHRIALSRLLKLNRVKNTKTLASLNRGIKDSRGGASHG